LTIEKFMLDADGKRILDADGKQGIHEDCCCFSYIPCEDCTGTQPSATVTVSGTCDAECDNFAATYVWVGYADHDTYCSWSWVQIVPDGWICLVILFTKYPGVYSAYMANYYQPSNEIWNFTSDDISEDVGCNKTNGRITGTFTLAGGGSDEGCAGCTATVTIG